MIVKTRWRFSRPPEVVWPLLCGAHMEPARGWLFRFGLPQPRECRLPSGEGGVGGSRQCESDQGVIDQRILTWDPPRRLSFRMEDSDIPRLSWVSEIVDDFHLVPTEAGGTTATRTTRVRTAGRLRWMKAVLLWVGLKQIHRFVFKNWLRLSQSGERAAGG